MNAPEWASEELPDGHVWCTACRSDLYLGEMLWPDPRDAGAEPGESVCLWVSCYVEEDDDEPCGEDILVKRVVAADGESYDGPPTNDWTGFGEEGGAP